MVNKIANPEGFAKNERLSLSQKAMIAVLYGAMLVRGGCQKLFANDTDRHVPVTTDRFDAREDNHKYHDKTAEYLYHQVLWRDMHSSGHRVEAWRFVDYPNGVASQLKNHVRQGQADYFMEGDYLRKVTANSHTESWSITDPEVVDKESHPEINRKHLSLNKKDTAYLSERLKVSSSFSPE